MYFRRLFAASAFLALLALPFSAFAQDTGLPSDVERLTSQPGNGSVHLNWDVATDDTGVTGYKIYFGTETVNNQNTNKYSTVIDAGDVIEYTITGLKNDTTYYFAVTAYDAARNESESYSPEVKATPDASLFAASILSEFGDSAVAEKNDGGKDAGGPGGLMSAATDAVANAPKLVSAEGISSTVVKVVFSEKVVLSSKNAANDFVIQDNLTLENLAVISANFDETDKEGKTVLVQTEKQIPDTEYVITAGPAVTDSDGNSLLSGKEDAALFVGLKEGGKPPEVKSAAEAKSPAEDGEKASTDGFALQKFEVMSDTILVLTFSEPIILSLDPLENFSISEKANPEKKLPITAVNVNDEATIVTLTTALQSNVVYVVTLNGIQNEDSEMIAEEKATFDFQGKGSAILDTTPPEDVTNLVARVLKEMQVRLQWKGSVNSAGDLLEYVLYQSADGGQTYGLLTPLSKDATKYEVGGLMPGDYYFKMTAKDGAGNESKGRTVKVRLVETGPGLGLIGFASVVLGRFFSRKKKKAVKKVL